MNGITGINSFHGLRTNYYIQNNKPSFKGNKSKQVLKTCGIALTAAAMLTLTSCSNKKQDSQSKNLTEVVDKNDSLNLSDNTNNTKVQKYYYYYPRANNMIDSGDYDWSETVYPDGSIERDSAGYKINIAPNGERTVTKIQKDNNENTITTTTEYTDGSRVVYIDSEIAVPKESVNDSITEQNDILDETDIASTTNDSIKADSIKTQKQIYKFYNNKNILLYWDIDISTTEHNDSANIFDKQGRLIFDGVKNEKYEYKNKRKTPYQSVIEYEGCKRYTIYKKDGSIKSVYFKALDGTITKQEDIDFYINF